jgi:5-formyltetrahydrofolate cyclo-ligase
VYAILTVDSGGGAELALANTVYQKLISLPEYKAAKNVSIYLSMPGGEVATDSIVEHAIGEGKKVFVPYLHKVQGQKGRLMNMLALSSLKDFKQACSNRDKWGIPTLEQSTIEQRAKVLEGEGEDVSKLDLILMPGVAFDSKLNRLGHGKGFYDHFLARYMALHNSEKRIGSDTEASVMPFLRKMIRSSFSLLAN